MEPIFIILFTAVGTIVGSVAGVFLAHRMHRAPSAENAALKMQLRTSESALADAAITAEELRTRVAELDKAVQDRGTELKKTREQLTVALAGGPLSAETGARELAIRAAALIDQCSELEARAKEEKSRIADEAARQAAEVERQRTQEVADQLACALVESAGHQQQRAALEAELASERQFITDLTGQLSCAATEAAEHRQQDADQEAELATGRRRVEELTDQLSRITAEAAERQQQGTDLEAELATERQRVQDLTGQLSRTCRTPRCQKQGCKTRQGRRGPERRRCKLTFTRC